MTSQEFEKLIDKEKYQVFILICPASLPFIFARHLFFVINKKGEISRWEVRFEKHSRGIVWGHIHKNASLPNQGIPIIPYIEKWCWPARLFLEINNNQKRIEIIEESKNNYPYKDRYFITGPNSNTYIQWILNQVPELKIDLPFNAFGKNYTV